MSTNCNIPMKYLPRAIVAVYRAVVTRPKFGLDRRNIDELLDECTGTGLAVVAPYLAQDLFYPTDAVFVVVASAVLCAMQLITLPFGSRTKKRRTPQGSSVRG